MKPTIEFIEGDPPASTGKSSHQMTSGYVLGVLTANPGQWARVVIDSTAPSPVLANRLKKRVDSMELNVEATVRNGEVYARVVT